LTQAALAEADAVIAYGDDDTIATLRRLAPARAQFLGYGHKFSFGVVAREAMNVRDLPALAEAAAFDASVYDQQGCLSPHAFYVEEGGELSPRDFAAALAEAMAAYETRVPRGKLSLEEAARMAKLREHNEFRAATDRRVSVWSSAKGCAWVVVYTDDPVFSLSCLNRFVYVRPATDLFSVPDFVREYASWLSTVGVAPMNDLTRAFAVELAKIVVHRVCPIGQMQRPPLSWHHDGQPNLGHLVRWMDFA